MSAQRRSPRLKTPTDATPLIDKTDKKDVIRMGESNGIMVAGLAASDNLETMPTEGRSQTDASDDSSMSVDTDDLWQSPKRKRAIRKTTTPKRPKTPKGIKKEINEKKQDEAEAGISKEDTPSDKTIPEASKRKPYRAPVVIKKVITEPNVVQMATHSGLLVEDDWSNEELEILLEAVQWYGAHESSLGTIRRKFFTPTKTLDQIRDKIEEIRNLNRLSTTCRENMENELWNSDRIKRTPGFEWLKFVNRMLSTAISSRETVQSFFCQDTLRKAILRDASEQTNDLKTYKISDVPNNGNGITETQVNWRKIYEAIAAWSVSEEEPRSLNNLESSIVLSVVDQLREEAINESEKKKRKLNGIFDILIQDDYRNFIPRNCPDPPEEFVAKFLVDPLNLSKWQILEKQSDEADIGETSNVMTNSPNNLDLTSFASQSALEQLLNNSAQLDEEITLNSLGLNLSTSSEE